MSDHLLDKVARIMASQVPRRQAVRLIATGLAAAVAAHFGIRSVLAQNSPNTVNGKCTGNTPVPCGKTCCSAGEFCLNNAVCCPSKNACISGFSQVCCSSGTICAGGQCCQPGQVCSSWGGSICCPSNYICVNGACCAPTQYCKKGNICCPPGFQCDTAGDSCVPSRASKPC